MIKCQAYTAGMKTTKVKGLHDLVKKRRVLCLVPLLGRKITI